MNMPYLREKCWLWTNFLQKESLYCCWICAKFSFFCKIVFIFSSIFFFSLMADFFMNDPIFCVDVWTRCSMPILPLPIIQHLTAWNSNAGVFAKLIKSKWMGTLDWRCYDWQCSLNGVVLRQCLTWLTKMGYLCLWTQLNKSERRSDRRIDAKTDRQMRPSFEMHRCI